ncbi:MAG: hypothetical protein AB4042_08980, partial [Leptolyngbyaceae cyanobacterium]
RVSDSDYKSRSGELKELTNSVKLEQQRIDLKREDELLREKKIRMGIQHLKVEQAKAEFSSQQSDTLMARYGAAIKKDNVVAIHEEWGLNRQKQRQSVAKQYLGNLAAADANKVANQDYSVASSLSSLTENWSESDYYQRATSEFV